MLSQRLVSLWTSNFPRFSTSQSEVPPLVQLQKHVYGPEAKPSGIVTIKLSNSEKLNAITEEMGHQFRSTVEMLRSDKNLRAVVLTGNGSSFSAGGDLDFLEQRIAATLDQNTDTMLKFYKRFLSIRSLNVPIIAAINGPAVGAGLCLSLACDIRIISNQAKIGFNFTNLGLHPGMGATHYLPQLIGPEAASRLLFTGELFTGEDARRIGLCLGAVQPDQVLPVALRLAEKVASASPNAVKATVRTLRSHLDQGLEAALIQEAQSQAQSFATQDILEGLSAIREKRKPQF